MFYPKFTVIYLLHNKVQNYLIDNYLKYILQVLIINRNTFNNYNKL